MIYFKKNKWHLIINASYLNKTIFNISFFDSAQQTRSKQGEKWIIFENISTFVNLLVAAMMLQT